MRHLAIVALLLAACGGKSDKAGTGTTTTTEHEGSGSSEAEPAAETHDVYGTLKAIDDEAEGNCFVTIIDNESDQEVLFPAPDLCGKGFEDYIDGEVALTIDADGNAIELSPMAPG
jgi:hypothetical protein